MQRTHSIRNTSLCIERTPQRVYECLLQSGTTRLSKEDGLPCTAPVRQELGRLRLPRRRLEDLHEELHEGLVLHVLRHVRRLHPRHDRLKRRRLAAESDSAERTASDAAARGVSMSWTRSDSEEELRSGVLGVLRVFWAVLMIFWDSLIVSRA